MSTNTAREFAIRAHGDQMYGVHPYVVHLDAVAELARHYGSTAEIVAYLHDVVEDTPTDLEAIEASFGPLVSQCVDILTDVEGDSRQERKKRTYAKMARVSGELELALTVKAADRLANLRACVADRRQRLLALYKGEQPAFREAVYRPNRCPELWREIDRICAEAEELSAPVPKS